MSKTYYLVDLNAVVVSEEAMNTITNELDTQERKTFLKKLIDNDHLEIVNVDKADDDDFVDKQVDMIDNYLNEDEKEAQYKKELKDRLIDLRQDINCYRLNGGYDPQHLDDAIDEFTEIETQLKEGEIT